MTIGLIPYPDHVLKIFSSKPSTSILRKSGLSSIKARRLFKVMVDVGISSTFSSSELI
jgi:hypothetical protein